MVPEVVICMFNLYDGRGGGRRPRYFPERFDLPALGGGRLDFRLVGQIEHAGSEAGGHYWARVLRAGGVYCVNDASASPSAFAPTADTCMVVYHYTGHTSS
jgi:hypothetical protein